MPEVVTLRCDVCDSGRNVDRFIVGDPAGVETVLYLCRSDANPLLDLISRGTPLALPEPAEAPRGRGGSSIPRGLSEDRLLTLHADE